MREIPKDIYDRLVFRTTKHDSTPYVVDIRPLEPCESCGKEIQNKRVVRIHQVVFPITHWREQCSLCNLCAVKGSNTWLPARELSEKLRKLHKGK
jgi:hypothetical protein